MSRKAIMNDDREITEFSYRNILMLFLPIAGASVSLAYYFLYEFYFNYHLASRFVLFFFASYLSCLLFFKINLINIGKHVLSINFLLQIAIHTYYLFPKDCFFHIYFIVGIPLIYMLFSQQQNLSRYLYSLISVSLLFVIEIGGSSSFTNDAPLTQDMITLIKNANVITSVIVLSVTIFIFTKMMEKAEERAVYNSITDHLTGLFNRRHFFTIANKMVESSKQTSSPLTLAFLDLDHFKTINDEYGHYIGDQVLKLVATTLKNNIHDDDIVARIGGEEFVIIFNNTNGQHGLAKAEVVRQAILTSEIPNTSKIITISIGVTELEKSDETINTLLKRADDALYQAKENGRNQIISIFSDQAPSDTVIPFGKPSHLAPNRDD